MRSRSTCDFCDIHNVTPLSLQWHFEIEAFSLELSQEYSRPERILERYLQRKPFSPEFSLESSPEPKKPSCHSRHRGILPGIFPEVEKTFVLCSPQCTMREVRSFLSCLVHRKGDQHEASSGYHIRASRAKPGDY